MNPKHFIPETNKNPSPIGLKPKKNWINERIKEILEAMLRYNNNGKDIPSEWITELLELNRQK